MMPRSAKRPEKEEAINYKPLLGVVYYIKLTETTKAFPKETYYIGFVDEILQDTSSKRNATLIQVKSAAKDIAKDIERVCDYKCEVCVY